MEKRRKRRRRRIIRFKLSFSKLGEQERFRGAFFIFLAMVLTAGIHPLIPHIIAMCSVGVWLVIRPPSLPGNRWLLMGMGGFILLSLLSVIVPDFLPDPQWKQVAVETYGIAVPSTISLQPMVTLQVLPLLLLGCAWLCLLLDLRVDHELRKSGLQWISMGICLLGLVILIVNAAGVTTLFADDAGTTSFFPNRNHTANLMAIGGILCGTLTAEYFRARRDWVYLGLVATLIIFAALFNLLSRGGIFLFFIGIVLWILLKAKSSGRTSFLKVGLPVVFLLFSGFLFFGKETRDRLFGEFSGLMDGESEFRILLFRDVWAMLKDHGVYGVGMGNFEPVFAQYRDHSLTGAVAAHPDSDWLWVLSEFGVFGLFAGIVLLVGVYQILWLGDLRQANPYRMILFIGVTLFLIHSAVDVPTHNMSTLFFVCLLLGLAHRHGRGRQARLDSFWVRRGFQGLGACLFLTGLWWGSGLVFKWPTHERIYADAMVAQIPLAPAERDAEQMEALTSARIAAFPLSWEAYFFRATNRLDFRENLQGAVEDFRAVRFLVPNSPQVAYFEGLSWLPISPVRALAAWREAIIRPNDAIFDFRSELNLQFRENPELQPAMIQLSEADTRLRYLFLQQARGPYLDLAMERDLMSYPDLSLYTEAERRTLLRRWAEIGQSKRLEQLLKEQPDIILDSWELSALNFARRGDLESAIRTIRKELVQPAIPGLDLDTNVIRLERKYRANPGDLLQGSTLLKRQIEERRWPQALQTAQSMSRYPEAPSYTYFWMGEIYYMQDDLARSWAAFRRYLQMRDLN